MSSIYKLDTAWHKNAHPISLDEEEMEPFENIDSQTIERFNNNYTSSFEQSMQFSDWLNLYQNPNFIFKNKLKEKRQIKDGIIEQ